MVSVNILDEMAEIPPVKGPRCSVSLFLDGLDPELASSLLPAMNTNGPVTLSNGSRKVITSSAIYGKLRALNLNPPSSDTIARHRRRRCLCP